MKIDEEKYAEEFNKGKSPFELGKIFNISYRTAERIEARLRNKGIIGYRKDLEINNATLILERQKQKNKDLGRIDRRTLREYLRLENAIVEYDKELIKVIKNYKPLKIKNQKEIKFKKGIPRGVLQLSDLHLNELVDLEINKSDFIIAAKRLKLLVMESKIFFKAFGVKEILIAMTGDLLNSDRRIEELLSQATNRSKATFLAAILLEQLILDLVKDFKISIINVVGNESRIQKDIGWTEMVASDNYDFTIFNILKIIFRNTSVNFIIGDSLEQVIEINGQNILVIHGNQLAGKLEEKSQKIKGKYTAKKIIIDFVISGHHHSAEISDAYSRSSSLVGANGYSDSSMLCISRASQNIHIFYKNGNRNSIKIDLQNIKGIKGYQIKKELAVYDAKSLNRNKKKTKITKI